MNKEEHLERENNGDIKIDYGKVDWQKIRQSQYTYIFKYYDERRNHYVPYFGLFSSIDERMDKAIQDSEFFEKQLYWTPDVPPYDFFIHYHNGQLAMLVEFFKEVFEQQAFLEGYQPSHKFSRIILPRPKYNEIMNCINEFHLLPIRDLLFEVIATGQKMYVDQIAFWERPEMQKLVTTAEKETQKVIRLLERLDTKALETNEPGAVAPAELRQISFALNDETIKIEHQWLASEFIDHFKEHYNNLHYKDWKADLSRYPDRFEDNIKKQQFKYKLAKSFYNLLTKTGAFKITAKEPTPNRLMSCIAKLLDFCLIPVAGGDEIEEIKIKNVRNWIRRKELEPSITFIDIPPDNERLLKYFEPEFIGITDNVKRADAISIGYFLSRRFNLHHLVNDLIHIAQALKEYSTYIGHQIIGENRPFEPHFEEFKVFSKLINGINNKKKLTGIKFKIEGDDKEFELTQQLPLYLIGQAIKEYIKDQQVEFDTEPVKTKVTRTETGFKVEMADHFLAPGERFMVRFVKSFYHYLLTEAPPKDEYDIMPSERYYDAIAKMLQMSRFFYHQMHPDWFTVQKVKQWHAMA